MFRSAGASKNPLASVDDVVGEDEVSAKTAPLERKKIQSTNSFFIWQFSHVFDAVCAPLRRCLAEGTVTTLAGRTPGLVSPEPATEAERSLVSEPQTHGEAETGFAEHDLPPVDNGVMS